MNRLWIIGLLLCSLVTVRASAQTWEYRVEQVDLVTKVRVFADDKLLTAPELEELLTPLGQEGWEMMGVISRNGTSMLVVFKRPGQPIAGAAAISGPAPPPPSADALPEFPAAATLSTSPGQPTPAPDEDTTAPEPAATDASPAPKGDTE